MSFLQRALIGAPRTTARFFCTKGPKGGDTKTSPTDKSSASKSGTAAKAVPPVTPPKTATAATSPVKAAPQYVSAATPVPPSGPVGPGAIKTGDYKCPEYYCYNSASFYDLEEEMSKYRLPQPSANNGRL